MAYNEKPLNSEENSRHKLERETKISGPKMVRPPAIQPASGEYPRSYWFPVSYFMKLTLYFVGSTYGPSKIAKPTVFQVVLRGIGKSFQSAITAPRMNLTGYGNATAQS